MSRLSGGSRSDESEEDDEEQEAAAMIRARRVQSSCYCCVCIGERDWRITFVYFG